MKLLIGFILLMTPLPASAITWNQFWRPINRGNFYYHRPYYQQRLCNRSFNYEERIPGNYYQPGYIRRWTEVKTVPC